MTINPNNNANVAILERPFACVSGIISSLITNSIAMLFVISEEIIPETHANGRSRMATFALLFGFIVMMILDNMLG